MSSQSPKKAAPARYTEEQKKEIIDFVLAYNAANKRGGQSKAVQKYKVSSVTLNGWLKNAADAPAESETPSKSGKAAKKSKTSKVVQPVTVESVDETAEAPVIAAKEADSADTEADSIASTKGRRYTSAEKNEILDFIDEYNRVHGRGGQSRAADKFKVSVMTISGWRNSLAGSFRSRKSASSVNPSVSANLIAKVNSLIELGNQIRDAETELAKLKSKFDSISASIKSSL
jgi:transposase-like protein